MIAVFDIQHYGQPGKNMDSRGAWADLDGDGHPDIWESEAELTPMYAYAASHMLAAAGIQVAFMPTGFSAYAQRAAEVIALQKHANERIVVVLCHLNAGAGDYALTLFHDQRKGDEPLARAIVDELSHLPEITRGVCLAAQAAPHWTSRARYCLDAYEKAPKEVTAVLVEPWFLDTKDHQGLAGGDGPVRVGQCIARAIIAGL